MTVDKRVQGIKVYVDGRSREIQEKLFELGARWMINGKEIKYEEYPFLYVKSNGVITCGNDMIIFKNGGYRGDCSTEVKADKLLSWSKQD